MEVSFTESDLQELDKIAAKYQIKESAIMPVLWYAQNKFGWISPEVMDIVANYLEVTVARVSGVVSFYTMFHTKPVGKYHLQVCTNVACMLRGGVQIFEYLSDKYQIKNMEVTPDGLFSLEEVECMGACGGAPMIAINEDYYENMTTDKIDALLATLH
jgi:NADH-quinone oxidoreductase E subunit